MQAQVASTVSTDEMYSCIQNNPNDESTLICAMYAGTFAAQTAGIANVGTSTFASTPFKTVLMTKPSTCTATGIATITTAPTIKTDDPSLYTDRKCVSQ